IALVLVAWIFSAGHPATRHALATDTIVQAGSAHSDRSGRAKTDGALQEVTAEEEWPDLDCQGSAIAPKAPDYSSSRYR
ncbi:hypothetical protein, partial [Serratia marcescens]|uniref:hypothetical protein n=1 Tax=Serratia marcescens TaxID=615 RepID=UPI0013DC96AF